MNYSEGITIKQSNSKILKICMYRFCLFADEQKMATWEAQ